MINFENNTRGLYEDGLRYIASDLVGIKKKDLVRKMNNFSDCNKFMDWVIKSAILRGKSRLVTEMVATLAYCYDFESAKRFYIPKRIKNKDVKDIQANITGLFEDSPAVYIETTAQDLGVILKCGKLDAPTKIGSVSFEYGVNIFVYGSALVDRMLPAYSEYKNVAKYLRFMSVSFTPDFEKFAVMIPDSSEFILSCCDTAIANVECDGECVKTALLVSPDYVTNKAKDTNMTMWVIANMALNSIKYVAYCYDNRYSLSRKNGKAHKHYESNKVYTAREDNSVDRLVSLRTYAKEYEPSTKVPYKGGHHASPIEHDRCAFYRKSRGAGDYDLIDGKFVYVGDKKGSYSYVKSTHVNGEKKSIVYKV